MAWHCSSWKGERAEGGSCDDGNVDIIDCGEGRKDTVYYDVEIDTVTNCEVLNPPTTTPSV